MIPDQLEILEGYCQCGCGNKTTISKRTDPKRGNVEGQPVKWVTGHSRNRAKGPEYIVNPDTGCWEWQLSLNNNGYGRKVCGQSIYAHIYYYQQKYGDIPKGLELDHKCKVRHCCNPDHLEPVTHTINMRRSARTKYTEETVKYIRQLKSEGLGSRKVSKLLGIPRNTVAFIMSGRLWKNV